MRYEVVKPETFEAMLEVLTEEFRAFGCPRKLSLADPLMVALLYGREYRTQFHLGVEFGVSESTVCRILQRVENAWIASEKFRLPGKKAVREGGTDEEVCEGGSWMRPRVRWSTPKEVLLGIVWVQFERRAGAEILPAPVFERRTVDDHPNSSR
ncbi:MAG: transposase family protein [Armatimonadetes bacterium]|nr:transposase family protein [Armatimonadota bacterium]